MPLPRFALKVIALLVAALSLSAGEALARFTSNPSAGSNVFNATTIAAPTGLSATASTSVTLNWTATTSTFASGYRVYRATVSGGPYTQIAQVTPRTTTTYVDSPTADTYYYVLRSYYQSWESADSTQAATGAWNTGLLNCSANAAVTSSSGDNDGYETNPSYACTNGSFAATDTDSGTDTGTTCSGSGKDRHVFYNYSISVPSGSTINGIEVHLDSWANSTTGSPFHCVTLSWNGGSSQTSSKSSSTLTTSEATQTLGGAADTWGRTWAVSELSNTNFRVRITNVASSTFRDFSLEWIAVRVSYTPP